jgi:hypothetical protein
MRAIALLVASAFVLSIASVGCADPWTVMHEARPAPYSKSANLVLEPVTFDDLKIGKLSEQAYLAKKDESTQQSFEGDKVGMVTQFNRGFDAERGGLPVIPAGIPGSNPFVIKPHITFIEPGFYTGTLISESTEVRASVEIFDARGDLVDEIALATKVSPLGNPENAASGTRERQAAEEIGRDTALYLKKRLGE